MTPELIGGSRAARGRVRVDPILCARWGVIVALLASVLGLTLACLRATGGNFAYGLDDPYIHLAIARNLAAHGVWGITPFSATAASSSPLWIIILASISLVAGAPAWLPFVLNLLYAAMATWLIHRRLIEGGVGQKGAFGWTLLIALGAPFGTLAFTGMEHSLQILLLVIWIGGLLQAFETVSLGAKVTKQQLAVMFAAGFALMLVRFESPFLFFFPFCAALARREYRLATCVALGPIAALSIFFTYCHFAGMPLIPNTILLKGNVPHGEGVLGFLSTLLRQAEFHLLTRNGYVMTPLLVCSLIAWPMLKRAVGTLSLRVLLGSLIVACVLHASCAVMSNFYRYEAYLVVGFALALVLAARRLPDRPVEGLSRAILLLLGFLLGYRTVASMIETPRASRDIYSQQIQMARFVHRYYDHGNVVLNDIGAVSYASHIHLLDLWGLASNDIRDLKRSQQFNRRTLKPILDAFHPDVTIAYPIFFEAALPPNIQPVADWVSPPVTTAAFPIVEFYASDDAGADRLRRALQDFAPSMPPGVKLNFVSDRWPHWH